MQIPFVKFMPFQIYKLSLMDRLLNIQKYERIYHQLQQLIKRPFLKQKLLLLDFQFLHLIQILQFLVNYKILKFLWF